MHKFYQAVDKRSRKAMTNFLKEHFRYHTMNSWNMSNSYAHNMKIHRLGLANDIQNKLFDLIQCEDFYETINLLKHDFAKEHNWIWQAGFSGRSGGYLVLYQGERKPSGYKSYCPACGQKNRISVSANSGKCGVCGDDRLDYTTPHMVINTFGRGTDEYEDYEDWEMCQLRERVELVQAFDKLADAIVAEAIYMAGKYEAGEEKYTVVQTRSVMIRKAAV